MTYYLSYIKDTLSNNYLGIKIEPGLVGSFLDQLKTVLSEEDYEVYTKNQQNKLDFHSSEQYQVLKSLYHLLDILKYLLNFQ